MANAIILILSFFAAESVLTAFSRQDSLPIFISYLCIPFILIIICDKLVKELAYKDMQEAVNELIQEYGSYFLDNEGLDHFLQVATTGLIGLAFLVGTFCILGISILLLDGTPYIEYFASLPELLNLKK